MSQCEYNNGEQTKLQIYAPLEYKYRYGFQCTPYYAQLEYKYRYDFQCTPYYAPLEYKYRYDFQYTAYVIAYLLTFLYWQLHVYRGGFYRALHREGYVW